MLCLNFAKVVDLNFSAHIYRGILLCRWHENAFFMPMWALKCCTNVTYGVAENSVPFDEIRVVAHKLSWHKLAKIKCVLFWRWNGVKKRISHRLNFILALRHFVYVLWHDKHLLLSSVQYSLGLVWLQSHHRHYS